MFGIIARTKFETEDGRCFNDETDATVYALARHLYEHTPLGTFESTERAESAARYILANFDISHKRD